MLTDDLFRCTQEYSKAFKKLCQPMMQYFGMNAVGFSYIHCNGATINLFTDIPWMSYCMEKEYFKDDPGMVSPENISSGIAFCASYEAESYQSGLFKDAQNFDLCHNCSVFEKEKNAYQSFMLNAPKKNVGFENKIVSSIPILRRMIFAIQREMNVTGGGMLDKYYVNLKDLKGQLFTDQKGLLAQSQKEIVQKSKALKSCGFTKIDLANIALTTQEKRCLRLYLYGDTIKEIADILGLSARTVESYLNEVKNKTACFHKQELIKIAAVLESLGKL